jgi:hypothetical protein
VARKKLDLTGALEGILEREQEAQRLFEESGRREQLFRSEEERAADETLLEEESAEPETLDEPESKTPEIPDPSEVIHIGQSNNSSRPTSRPDDAFRHGDDYYLGGSRTSTRVQGIQWIPTTYISDSIPAINNPLENSKAMMYGFDAGAFETGVFGDILVAFARPSKAQNHAIYVFSGNSKSQWDSFSNSPSLGRSVKILSGGRLLQDGDESRYKELHKATDTKDAWEDWLFDYPEFRTIRAGNSRE